MELGAFTLLCSLGPIVLIASTQHCYSVLYWIAGFFSALLIFNPGVIFLDIEPVLSIEPSQISILLSLIIFAKFMTLRLNAFFLFIAGLYSSLWFSVQVSQDMPVVISGLIVVPFSLFTFWCVKTLKGFTNARLLEEALLIIFILALGVGILPELIVGWQSALSFQNVDDAPVENKIAPVILLITLIFTILGGLFARLKHR